MTQIPIGTRVVILTGHDAGVKGAIINTTDIDGVRYDILEFQTSKVISGVHHSRVARA
jgi:hypothetical protein